MLSKEKVEAVLFKMGMPANVKGFGYIVDSVLLLEEDSKIKTTYLYFKVAQQHGTTGQRVERAIRHAFDIVRSCRGDYDVVNHYIGFIKGWKERPMLQKYLSGHYYSSEETKERRYITKKFICAFFAREQKKCFRKEEIQELLEVLQILLKESVLELGELKLIIQNVELEKEGLQHEAA